MNEGQRIEPFRALVYGERLRGALSDVVAPPYDLIDSNRQDDLYRRSPYNIIRLELNRDADRYGSAAATLKQWRREGVLAPYPRPAIYLYTQRFPIEGRVLTRHGFVVRIALEEFGHNRILPHERTFPAAKEDRLKLLIATETNISSVFGLYGGAHPALDNLRERMLTEPPLLKVRDEMGIDNEVRAIEQPSQIELVQRELAAPRILIADGHHRYETALNYRRMRRTADAGGASRAYDYTMMTLAATDDPGLVILPTHRIVRRLPPEAMREFARRAREEFEIEEMTDGDALRAALRCSSRGALGVALKGDRALRLLKLKSAYAMAAAMPDAAPAVRELDVSVLHAPILDGIFGIRAEAIRAGGNVEYTIDAQAALEKVAHGEADGAFLMNPPSVKEVERVSDAGATMPEKSTYFQPKLLTGLLLNQLDDGD